MECMVNGKRFANLCTYTLAFYVQGFILFCVEEYPVMRTSLTFSCNWDSVGSDALSSEELGWQL